MLPVLCIEALSEAVKVLKGEYLVRAINEHKMDQVRRLYTMYVPVHTCRHDLTMHAQAHTQTHTCTYTHTW